MTGVNAVGSLGSKIEVEMNVWSSNEAVGERKFRVEWEGTERGESVSNDVGGGDDGGGGGGG